jgi:hypothetical protein
MDGKNMGVKNMGVEALDCNRKQADAAFSRLSSFRPSPLTPHLSPPPLPLPPPACCGVTVTNKQNAIAITQSAHFQ